MACVRHIIIKSLNIETVFVKMLGKRGSERQIQLSQGVTVGYSMA